jgi:MFS family permease
VHGIQGFIFISIPFLFLEPLFYNEKEKLKRISQNDACSRGSDIIIAPSEIESITLEFNLFCESAWIKSLLIMLLLLGLCISGLFFTLYSVDPKKRLYVITLGSITSSIFALLNIFGYDDSLIFLAISMFLAYLFSYCWYGNIYTYLNEVFPKETRRFLPSVMTCFYGFGTVCFVLVTYSIKDWRSILRYYYGIPNLMLSLTALIYAKVFKIEKIEEENVKKKI